MENFSFICTHASADKNLTWQSQKFSDKFNAEYEYCFCRICKKNSYTGNYRFVVISEEVNILNRNNSSAKEQNNMSKENSSVSRSIKSRHAKEGAGVSLKEFARRLAANGDQSAKDWFAYKLGALNESRSEKNKIRIVAEKNATKLSKKKKKGTAPATATATTVTAKSKGTVK